MARRFVTYNTEDQKAGKVNVDERGVMMPSTHGSGGTLIPNTIYVDNNHAYKDLNFTDPYTMEEVVRIVETGGNFMIIDADEYDHNVFYPVQITAYPEEGYVRFVYARIFDGNLQAEDCYTIEYTPSPS